MYLLPEVNTFTSLFNPQLQILTGHFTWSEDSTQIIGLTAIGRTTVAALSLNSELRVRARAIWVEMGWHPPKLDN